MKTPDEVVRNLPDFQAWSAGKERFDLIDYSMCTSTPDVLCSVLELIDPELIEHEGDYFLAHQFDPETYKAWRAKINDARSIQKVMNHIHISSLLQGQEIADIVAVHIAQGLARCWNRAFQHLGLKAESYGSGLEDAEVTLYRA